MREKNVGSFLACIDYRFSIPKVEEMAGGMRAEASVGDVPDTCHWLVNVRRFQFLPKLAKPLV